MKERMLNNFSIKILSILGAIIMWIVIVNIYDPSIKVTVSGIPMQLINEESLSNMGYSYEIEDESKISVYVTGPRSLVSSISASDIEATVDLSTVNIYSDYLDVVVRLKKTGTQYAGVEVAPKTNAVKVKIENRSTQNYEVQATMQGTPASGYVVGDYQISPSAITITGAQSIIKKISAVRVNVNVTGATGDIETTGKIEVLDANGKVIPQDKLDMSRKEIDIRVSVLPVKEIEIIHEHAGNPDEGYRLTGFDYETEKIKIAATADKLAQISKLEIPAEAIDITGITEDTTYTVDISKYVPEGVRVVGETGVSITARVERLITKEIELLPENITIENLPQGLEAVINSGVKVVVRGIAGELAGLNATSLRAKVDGSKLAVGSSDAELIMSIPQGCTLVDRYSVKVDVTQIQESESESETTTD